MNRRSIGSLATTIMLLLLCQAAVVPKAFADYGDYMLHVVPAPITIGFTEAMKIALERNNGLKGAELGIFVAEGEALISTSKLLPRISLKASHTTTNKGGASGADDNAMTGLSALVPLLDSKALIEMKSKRELSASAKDKYQSERDTLISEVGSLYIEAAIAKALSDNANEEQELYKKQMAIFERKSKVGAARALDIRRAQYMAAKAYSDSILKRQEYLKKMGDLGKKIGVNDFFLLSSVSINSPNLHKSASELVEIANASPDVSSIKKEINAAQFALTSEKFDFLPKFNATVDGGWLFPTANNIVLPEQRSFSVRMMFNMEWSLFSGGSTLGSIKAATARRSIQDFSLRTRLNEKLLGVNGLLEQIKDLEVAKTNADLAVEAAQLAKESAERMFERNEATGLELVEANTNHFTAKNLLANTSLRLEQAKLRLLFLIGRVREII